MISKEKLIELYIDKQLSPSEIAEIFKCDRKTVGNYLRKYEIPIRNANSTKMIKEKKKGTYITIEDILDRIEKGYLLKDIKDEFGVSRSKISNICKENGYNFRNHKNAITKQSKFMQENNPVKRGQVRSEEVKAKSRSTKQEKYINKIKSINIDEISFKKYAKLARSIAYKYGYNKKVPEGYHIDHMFSVKDGYENKVPLLLISHKENLRIVPKIDNLSKADKSLFSLMEFYDKVGVQRLSEME